MYIVHLIDHAHDYLYSEQTDQNSSDSPIRPSSKLDHDEVLQTILQTFCLEQIPDSDSDNDSVDAILQNALRTFTQPRLPSHQPWLHNMMDGLNSTFYATAPPAPIQMNGLKDQAYSLQDMLDGLDSTEFAILPSHPPDNSLVLDSGV